MPCNRTFLAADTSIAELTQRSTGSHVRVVSPQAEEFAPVLEGVGARVTFEDGALLVTGLDTARIAELAAARRIVLHELAPHRASLEAALMELTQGSVEYQAAGCGVRTTHCKHRTEECWVSQSLRYPHTSGSTGWRSSDR